MNSIKNCGINTTIALKRALLISLIMIFAVTCLYAKGTNEGEENPQLNIYSSRHYEVDDAIYNLFTQETGIKINVVKGGADELIERIKTDASNQADLFFTVDITRLHRAEESGLFQTFELTSAIRDALPSHLISDTRSWLAISQRARVIVYNHSDSPDYLPSSYLDLADNRMNAQLLIRSSSNTYNQALVASMLARNGEEATRVWVRGVVKQMARKPKGNDRDQMKALIGGEGQYAVVNTYYVGLLQDSPDAFEQEVGNAMGVIFPPQTHMNISGVGIVKDAKNKKAAQMFLEFMLTDSIQEMIMNQNFEYPASLKVPLSPFLQSLGTATPDTISLNEVGKNTVLAITIMQEEGWE